MPYQLPPSPEPRRLPLAVAALAIASCDGSSSSSATAFPPAQLDPQEAAAARFLARATFGPTPSGIDALACPGPAAPALADWLDEQFALPPSLGIEPALAAIDCSPMAAFPPCPESVIQTQWSLFDQLWWERALFAPDQLRQRIAFALGQLFVVSRRDPLLRLYPRMVADFDELLVLHAFDDFRTLLEAVARHPAMGTYLSVVKSRVADAEEGNHPDENFAREAMQLFTIGLVELNPDGSVRTDAAGDPVPTYDQDQIEALARVFTGYNYGQGESVETVFGPLHEFLAVPPAYGVLEHWPAFHAPGQKDLVSGATIPAGTPAPLDLDQALDVLASHPNVGPFVARRLIQRLVTSNPSPAYLERVATVWADDGSGRRGNLEAVVRTILIDPEADAAGSDPDRDARITEPILRLTALWRAFRAEPVMDAAPFPGSNVLGQAPYDSPSVFNFFSPDDTTPSLAAQGLVAPEAEVSDHDTLVSTANFLSEMVLEGTVQAGSNLWRLPQLDVGELVQLVDEPGALVDLLDLRLFGGAMAPDTRAVLLEHLSANPAGLGDAVLASEVLLLAVASPDYAVQS